MRAVEIWETNSEIPAPHEFNSLFNLIIRRRPFDFLLRIQYAADKNVSPFSFVGCEARSTRTGSDSLVCIALGSVKHSSNDFGVPSASHKTSDKQFMCNRVLLRNPSERCSDVRVSFRFTELGTVNKAGSGVCFCIGSEPFYLVDL